MKLLIVLLLTCLSIFAKEKLPESEKVALLKILEINEQVHSSFFGYKVSDVVLNAKKILDIKSEFSTEKLKGEFTKFHENLGKISASNSQEDNYKFYAISNISLVKIINAYDLGEKYQAYYCPMVKKKWIQNVEKDAKVNNPYDSSMPHCGGRL